MPGGKIKQLIFEEKVDDLERRLVERIEITSGFAEAEQQARKMQSSLKFFDAAKKGALTYDEFFAAMTSFNLVGVQREVEALFNRYDEYLSGFLDYSELSSRLWGLSPNAITLDKNSRAVIYKLKSILVSVGGVRGYHALSMRIKALYDTSSGSAPGVIAREHLRRAFADVGITGLTTAEWDVLYDRFDVYNNGFVFANEILRYIRGGMSLNRKQLVLTAFERLDPNETGVLKVDDILHNFDFSALPAVADGMLTPDEAASEMLESFESGGDIEGKVTWAEFLDYFAGMSLAIDDGDYFELMVRNALKPSGPSPSKRFAATHATARRVKVTFNDGKQQVVEVADEDIEAAQFSADEIIHKLNSRGVRNVAEIQILK